MTIEKPYRRMVRQFADGKYAEGGRWMYVRHPKYATDPAHFIRSFLMIQRDLQNIFDFIEPSDANRQTYSYRIHQLFMVTCIEIEANFKAIFLDNDCDLGNNGNIRTYEKVGISHRLSEYSIKIPLWGEHDLILTPFINWPNPEGTGPKWYQAYNSLKHNRHENFRKANLENLLNAITGLATLLTAQFQKQSFLPEPDYITVGGIDPDGFEPCIGDYFTVRYPTDWPEEERYNFNWRELESMEDPFQNYPYCKPKKS